MKNSLLARELRLFHGKNGGRECVNPERLALTAGRRRRMEAFAAAHPDADALAQRRKVYELLREDFQPILFPHSPFYFEMGGNGGWNASGIGRWVLEHNVEPRIVAAHRDAFDVFQKRAGELFYLCCGPFFDAQHNSPPLSNILKKGFSGVYREALAARGRCRHPEETAWVETALAGLETVKVILEKYAYEAASRLATASDDDEKKYMAMIAASAAKAPWNPPETFYEALNTCWFVREVVGEMDGLMINSLGRPDAWLYSFYTRDRAEGRLTEAEAYDLVCRFLMHGDLMYDHDVTVESYGDHENEIAFTLGGCDERGDEVFNDLTVMFLRAHRELNAIYPKPHCRYSRASSGEYLRLIGEDLVSGRGVYSLVNDDCLIPALVKSGKTPEDARDYSITGCWDPVVDSREDNTGGNYFNLARVVEATIHDSDERLAACGLPFKRLDAAADFEQAYRVLMDNTLTVFRDLLTAQGVYGALQREVAPAPLDSACSSDCLIKLRDFTEGGQRYNPHAVLVCFFANFLDSLLAIKTLCFERRVCTLPELLKAVRENWRGADALRRQVLQAPHWGDARPETTALASRVLAELRAAADRIVNARGGHYQLGFAVYREFRFWGEKTKALPDGRRDGDLLAQGLNPSHFRADEALTTVLRAIGSIDLTQYAGNSVVNCVLNRSSVTPETLEALLRVSAEYGLQLLQLNCASREELLDAQQHPEAHPNLVVRVCGFSAKFVALSKEWQEEVLNRKSF